MTSIVFFFWGGGFWHCRHLMLFSGAQHGRHLPQTCAIWGLIQIGLCEIVLTWVFLWSSPAKFHVGVRLFCSLPLATFFSCARRLTPLVNDIMLLFDWSRIRTRSKLHSQHSEMSPSSGPHPAGCYRYVTMYGGVSNLMIPPLRAQQQQHRTPKIWLMEHMEASAACHPIGWKASRVTLWTDRFMCQQTFAVHRSGNL